MTRPIPRAVDVAVIGGGCAGLAAAAALAERGARVALFEQSPRLGGRATAFTDKVTGERVDNGQHVLFGCYHQTYAFLRRVGAERLAPLAPRLRLPMVGADGTRADLTCPSLPPPWHLVGGLATWKALSIADKWRARSVGRALLEARRHGAEAVASRVPASMTVDAWLSSMGQTDRANAWLWHPLTLAALNQAPDVAAAAPFVRVLGELFGPRAEDAAVGLASVPLEELFGHSTRQFVESRGGSVHLRARATVEWDRDRIAGVRVEGEVVRAAAVISAVPWFGVAGLWQGEVPAALKHMASNAQAIRGSSIVTVNLWTDGPVIDEPFIGLVDGPVHWIFDRAAITRGAAHNLALVTSGADEFAALGHADVVARAWKHVQSVFPSARSRSVRHAVVVRERRATFSLAPGGPARPTTVTRLGGFYLAGDWTDTGLPATIEGAVVSGHAAAAAAGQSAVG